MDLAAWHSIPGIVMAYLDSMENDRAVLHPWSCGPHHGGQPLRDLFRSKVYEPAT